MIRLKSLLNETITAHGNGSYYYRVHPKGDIGNVIRDGLYSYSPNESPGAYIDAPEQNTWPDQEPGEGTYRFYVANTEWTLSPEDDRIRIRIPQLNLEKYRVEKDSLGDYYIDTGNDSKKILEPNQYDIKIGNKWIRADMIDPIMKRYWKTRYYKQPGYYKNKFYNDEEEPNDEI